MDTLHFAVAAPGRDDVALDNLAEGLGTALRNEAGIATAKARQPGGPTTLSGAEIIFGQLISTGVAAATSKVAADLIVCAVKSWLESRRTSEVTVEISPTNHPDVKVKLTGRSLGTDELNRTIADVSAMLEKMK